jgi:hypothetical protein
MEVKLTQLHKRTGGPSVVLEKPNSADVAAPNNVQKDAPDTAGEEQDGFEGSAVERQKRRQDNIEAFDAPEQHEDKK